ATVPTTKTEPLRMSTLPSGPWKELSMDFAELPTDKIFSEYGIPEKLRSDNGPPFNGNEFREFANYLGFLHRTITPYWPRANGEAERFMRTIKKAVKAALIEGNRVFSLDVPGHVVHVQHRLRLPQYIDPQKDEYMHISDEYAKAKMKLYADAKASVKPAEITKDDSVLLNQLMHECMTPCTLRSEGKERLDGHSTKGPP
ncbi:hypothetical protein QZH41_012061, partial [Actinostola sp. cb2023]